MATETNQELIALLKGGLVEWYPSAGGDLQNIRSVYRPRHEKSPRPNVFIHTDWWYAEVSRDDFADEIKDYDIILRKVKELPRLPAKSHQFCVFAQENAPNAGRCVEYDGTIKLNDDRVEHFTLVKIAMENEQFAAEFLLPNQICLEALVHKNCGWGCGGGATIPGTWMRGVLSRLKTKYFITDWHGMNGARSGRACWIEGEVPGRDEAARVFPILGESIGERLSYRDLWEECWEFGSPHGGVKCFAVVPYENEESLKKSLPEIKATMKGLIYG